MSEVERIWREVDELKRQMRTITQSLVSVSEANGCALDALLALLPSLGPNGLLAKNEEGKSPFVEALKAQHAQLYSLNAQILKLMDEVGLDSSSVSLSPSSADEPQ